MVISLSLSTKRTMVEVHHKMIKRWAEVYVKKLLENKPAAQEWARRFLPQEHVDAVAAESRTILKKKGYKVVD